MCVCVCIIRAYLGEKRRNIYPSALAQTHARNEIVRLRYNCETIEITLSRGRDNGKPPNRDA